MDKLLIEGGRPLEGSVRISGAKNAALPAMAAALLTSDRVELDNIPRVRDIITMGRLLAHMGAIVETPDASSHGHDLSGRESQRRRSALRTGAHHARVDPYARPACRAHRAPRAFRLPGGCSIGARPVDLHLKALEQMGAEIGTSHGYVEARVPGGGRLRGGKVFFDKITVTGTENILMAAALAEGETQIENAAREPEITDLADLLIKMGADIEGAGTSTIRVRGKEKLHGAKHTIIPDRIEAGTFLVAGAITNGALELTDCEPEHLTSIIAKLRETGVDIRETGRGTLCVHGAKKLVAADVRTEEYPGFATDMQAQFMALATQAEGTSVITETIFENRFLHASEMIRMGANISIEGRRAVVHGPTALSGTGVIASDLRASASLVLAALVAQGRNDHRPRLPHRSRLRAHRRKTFRRRRANSPRAVDRLRVGARHAVPHEQIHRNGNKQTGRR